MNAPFAWAKPCASFYMSAAKCSLWYELNEVLPLARIQDRAFLCTNAVKCSLLQERIEELPLPWAWSKVLPLAQWGSCCLELILTYLFSIDIFEFCLPQQVPGISILYLINYFTQNCWWSLQCLDLNLFINEPTNLRSFQHFISNFTQYWRVEIVQKALKIIDFISEQVPHPSNVFLMRNSLAQFVCMTDIGNTYNNVNSF